MSLPLHRLQGHRSVSERALYTKVYRVGDQLFPTSLVVQSLSHLSAFCIVGKFHGVKSGLTFGIYLHFVLKATLGYIGQSLVNESA